ncbi:MAG: hypothetical protein M3312_02900 [Actinomycetota bacterium]|nr:hypothetical protein [Actinomycetota bacterium]
MDAAARIAETVLYEGYLLWPYRRSALKNRKRWTFGGVYPRAYSEAGHPDDPWRIQTQCLVTGKRRAVDVRVRFLHVVERQVRKRTEGGLEAVDELTVNGERHLSWEEAVERELSAPGLELAALAETPHVVPVSVPSGNAEEPLLEGTGEHAGAIVRSWRELAGEVEILAEALPDDLHRLTVRIVNTTPWAGGDREEALRQTFCSTHTVLRALGGEFVSLTDPPPAFRPVAEACENVGAWPVLVGDEARRDTLLSSPIVLSDFPQIAPESPGDLFDGTEIDQLLILNVLALTDEEREEMRASDPRARAILDRCASLSPEELMRLHGAIREFRPVSGP